jgi:hypothetical protein
MKEFGIRTRQYKQLFDVWETLHTNKTKSQRFVQDDVLQRLYQNPSIATLLDRDMAQIVHSYESYRSIVTQLSTLLFPWTAPYFADHLQLRQQLQSAPRGLVFSPSSLLTHFNPGNSSIRVSTPDRGDVPRRR